MKHQTFSADSQPALTLEGGVHVYEDCVFVATNAWEVVVMRGATVTLRRCRIADGMNRGVFVDGGRVILEDCEIVGNRLGVFVTGGAQVDLTRCRIAGPGSCGLLWQKRSTGILLDCSVSDVQDGALVMRDAAPRVIGGSFSAANNCVRAEASGRGELSGCQIGPGDVGVWICPGADPILRDCRIAGHGSAAVWCEGKGRFERCIVEGNGMGVCIVAGGDPRVLDCDLRGGPFMAIQPLPGAKGRFEGCRISGDSYDGVVTGDWAETVIV